LLHKSADEKTFQSAGAGSPYLRRAGALRGPNSL